MPSDVYTCTEFPSRLPRILQRHPHTSTLLLQLSRVSSPRDSRERACLAASGAKSASPRTTWTDTSSEFLTFYAVLLRRLEREHEEEEEEEEGAQPPPPHSDQVCSVVDGDPRIEDVCVVVGHASHLSLRWCAQLQHTLSVSSLLLTESWRGDSTRAPVRSVSDSTFATTRRRRLVGVTQLQVRLSPYVPVLQWDRHVDGVLGSHHVVCAAHSCCLADSVGGAESSVGAAFDTSASAGAGEALPAGSPAQYRCASKSDTVPQQRTIPAARADGSGRIAETHVSLPWLYRVAAILNGSIPLPPCPNMADCICVLFLVAQDGCALTAATAAPPPAPAAMNVFEPLCDFLANDVVPAISLEVVDGMWAVDGAGCVLQDVCGARERLGSSCAIRVPASAASGRQLGARSITFVVDFSTPLCDELVSHQKRRTSSAALTPAGLRRGCLARQVAAAVQETLCCLVSANIDAFSFASPVRRDNEMASPDGPEAAGSGAVTQLLTREMLCRSIAESVSRIVGLSPHPAFRAEVTRLLWGREGARESPCGAGTAGSDAQPSMSAIQRRIEERLRALSAD